MTTYQLVDKLKKYFLTSFYSHFVLRDEGIAKKDNPFPLIIECGEGVIKNVREYINDLQEFEMYSDNLENVRILNLKTEETLIVEINKYNTRCKDTKLKEIIFDLYLDNKEVLMKLLKAKM